MSGLRSRPNFREKPHRVDRGTHPPANRNKTNVNASKLKLPRLQDQEDRLMHLFSRILGLAGIKSSRENKIVLLCRGAVRSREPDVGWPGGTGTEGDGGTTNDHRH